MRGVKVIRAPDDQPAENSQRDANDTAYSQPASGLSGVNCYIWGILFPLLYLATAPRRQNQFIRFHCFQSLVLFFIWVPLNFIPRFSRTEGTIVSAISFICLASWIIAMIQAYRGKMFHLPGLGILAEWLAKL
jgi:uncharacterized membrane protein